MSGAGHFADRLAEAVERKGGPLCVGLDPDPGLMPAGVSVRDFCRGIVEAVAEHAVAVKPQSAFFEALGADGWATLLDVCAFAREAGVLVVVDAKRGDVGSTATAYAAAFAPFADAVTVNPYLGRDSLEPFFAKEGLGVLCIVKTSNPGSGDLQDLPLAGDGALVWQRVARLVGEWGEEYAGERGLSRIGAVVGATYPREVAEARELLPRAPLLLPGVGAQGGRIDELAPAFSAGPGGALVSASRSVLYADSGPAWREAAAAEAARLAAELRVVAQG